MEPDTSVVSHDSTRGNGHKLKYKKFHSNLLSMDFMIKQSIQKTVTQLEDKTDNSRHATEKIMIIHNLLFQDHSRTTCHPKVPVKEPTKLFQALIKNVLMPDGSNPEMMQAYTNDFLRMTFPGQDLSVYEYRQKPISARQSRVVSKVTTMTQRNRLASNFINW
ncbi:hypothetical protein QYF61_014423 [Mycteria americana]|uniref:Uncharacterized protein n=1 Tax=Mycteria americana TaxID=33587 RepID=A0AAN7NV07_MYCAM|nr:hypothetical protein QYF61_014423 [Mycteria americana]